MQIPICKFLFLKKSIDLCFHFFFGGAGSLLLRGLSLVVASYSLVELHRLLSVLASLAMELGL